MIVPDKAGLLRHAQQYSDQSRGGGSAGPSGSDKAPAYGEEQGITPAERKEIIARIEKIAGRRSISPGAEELGEAPQKREFIFPLMVNILVLGFTAIILLGISNIFRQKEAQAASGSAVVTTAEGRLIQELRRDSDSRLQEKDKDIAEIQGQLKEVDAQRDELSANIDQQVEIRANELKTSLNAEIAKERARLVELGNSETTVQAKLKAFEQAKTSEMALQLAEIRKKAELDKAEQEARLSQISQEYQKNIAGLNDERNRILAQSKSREEALRASLEAKTSELAGQSAAAKAELERAKSELGRMEDERSRNQSAEDRILGLYASIQAALRDHRYQDALSSVSALESYLGDPQVQGIPSVRSRRESDLFIADALGSLAKSEQQSASADTARLLDQAASVAAVRAAAEAGGKAAQAGDLATADAKYMECLSKIPEILSAYEYFAKKAEAEEGAREKAASDSKRADDSAAARQPFSAAEKDLGEGRWAQAIAGFIGVVASYPSASQVPDALKDIGSAREGMDKEAKTKASAYEAELADLRASSAKATAASQAELENLKRQLADIQSATAGAAVRSGAIGAGDAAALSSGDPQKLAALHGQIDGLKKQYTAFVAAWGPSGNSSSGDTLLDRQKSLDNFLGSDEAKAIFPDLERLVDQQVMAYRQRISVEELRTIADIAIQTANAATAQQKQSLLDTSEKHFKDDPAIAGFVAALREMLKQT